jgi:hypothetical protein
VAINKYPWKFLILVHVKIPLKNDASNEVILLDW